MEQLKKDSVHFVARSFYLLLAEFCANWCRQSSVTADRKVGHFWDTM